MTQIAGGDRMAEHRVERQLAAILAGDVAGYSRLMGADEEGALARLAVNFWNRRSRLTEASASSRYYARQGCRIDRFCNLIRSAESGNKEELRPKSGVDRNG